MKSAGKARSNGLYRHIRTSKEIIRNLLNDYSNIYRKDLVIVYLSNTLFYQNISKSFLNSSYHITGIQFHYFL